MKRILILLAAVAAFASASAEPFKIANRDLPELIGAFNALDGSDVAVDQGPGNPQRVIRKPYTFSGDVRARLGANLAVLTTAYKSAVERRNAEFARFAEGRQELKPADAGFAPFKAFEESLNVEAREYELSPVPITDLQLEVNPIPISVQAALAVLKPKPAHAVK